MPRHLNISQRVERPVDADSAILLPVQVRAPHEKAGPEQRLLLAVLEEAVREYDWCLQRTGGRRRRRRAELEQWFASDDDSWPFSFGNICNHFGIDRSFARSRLGMGGATERAA